MPRRDAELRHLELRDGDVGQLTYVVDAAHGGCQRASQQSFGRDAHERRQHGIDDAGGLLQHLFLHAVLYGRDGHWWRRDLHDDAGDRRLDELVDLSPSTRVGDGEGVGVQTRRGPLLVAVPITLVGLLLASGTDVAWATTNWTVTLHISSSGESDSSTIPSAPSGVTAACDAPTSSKTIDVSWTAVAHASTYTVYDSTTSVTGTYSSVATGVTTTSWTSGTLKPNKNYWFEVTAIVGSNWESAQSSATAESTINPSSPYCSQP
jgi:hypothetical protein